MLVPRESGADAGLQFAGSDEPDESCLLAKHRGLVIPNNGSQQMLRCRWHAAIVFL
jgi:hypothetical protein